MKKCSECGGERRVFFNQKYQRDLCDTCRVEMSTNGGELLKVHKLPSYGQIEYDENGNVICHVCGKAYRKVLSHAYYRHNIVAKEYKRIYGLDLGKGICNQQLKEVLRGHVYAHYDVVVQSNLIQMGENTRFSKGSEGRTRDMISRQTINKLKRSFKQGSEGEVL